MHVTNPERVRNISAILLALDLSKAPVLLLTLAFCQSVQSKPTTPIETYTVRVEIDDRSSSSRSVKSTSLTSWSKNNNIYKIVQPEKLGTLSEVVKQSVRNINGEELRQLIALNSESGEKNNQRRIAAEIVKESAQRIIMPIGLQINNKSVPTHALSQSQKVVTLSRAQDDSQLKIHASTTALVNNSVLIPDTDFRELAISNTRTVQLELTASELASLNSSGIRSTIVRGKLPITLETSSKIAQIDLDNTLSSELKAFLMGKPPPKVKPLLIILDDGWPTEADFLATKNFIGRNLPSLWKNSSDLSSLETPPALKRSTLELATPGPPSGSNCISLADCDFHSRRIHHAITPIRELTKNGAGEEPVDIIYIPLNKAQLGAEDILEALWEVAYSTGRDLAPNSPMFFEKPTFDREKSGFLNSIPSEIFGNHFDTNWGVVSSVIHFANRYSLLTGAPVLINTSWTTTDIFGFNPPSALTENIIIVAAAGNHCKDNICGEFADKQMPERQFIHRAANSNDVVLVVNQDDKGNLTCGSSRVQTNYPVVGFDGAINGDCGTSFSAPRVALLFALRLAYHPMDKVGSRLPMKRFANWLQTRPGKPRCKSEMSFDCILLTPSQLFSKAALRNN